MSLLEEKWKRLRVDIVSESCLSLGHAQRLLKWFWSSGVPVLVLAVFLINLIYSALEPQFFTKKVFAEVLFSGARAAIHARAIEQLASPAITAS